MADTAQENTRAVPFVLRDQLERIVGAELLGPASGPEEILDERAVGGRHLVGILAPKRKSALREDSQMVALGGVDDRDSAAELAPLKPATMLASSIG